MRKVNIELFTGDISGHKRLKLNDFSIEDFIGIFENKKILESLIEQAEVEIIEATKEGINTGYSIGHKSPNARIVDESKVVKHMNDLGIETTKLYVSKMVSIGALKKLTPIRPKEFDLRFADCIQKVGDVKEVLIKKEEDK